MIKDLTAQSWTLSGWTPYLWMLGTSMELGEKQEAEYRDIPVHVPGSVQGALRDAGIIPDWNYAGKARLCEWVENRHWAYTTRIDSLPAAACKLVCSLDGSGWVLWDGRILTEFPAQFRPHCFRLPDADPAQSHTLSIVFDLPPRWLGQFGHTSKFTVGKARFYYTWDWMPRLVQTAITSPVEIRPLAEKATAVIDLRTEDRNLYLRVRAAGKTAVRLYDGVRLIYETLLAPDALAQGVKLECLPVAPWQPNGSGEARLYTLEIGEEKRRVGFRKVVWKPCRNAPKEADPWRCEINGKAVFLQGVNWTPIRPNYADVPDEEYRKRLLQYRDMGVNLFRVWGGATIERELFYELCDEYGIMVWQEFPMSSSGVENLPPSDEEKMKNFLADADYYLSRLTPHVSLLMWCGGNELQRDLEGHPYGSGKPCTKEEPLLAQLAALVGQRDPGRRFMPTSASGPREFADEKEYGKGLHWDVHGPWKAEAGLDEKWHRYWDHDDSLLRSEVGAPGASPLALVEKYGCPWDYPLSWWDERRTFELEHARPPASTAEYITWSQTRQAVILSYVAGSCKKRFPACGGVIIWMGHDSFPLAANTSVLDFNGDPKPAALALREIFTHSR